jgi:uncharacterized protein YggE
MKPTRILVIALLAATLIAVVLVSRPEGASSAASDQAEDGITVVATGTVEAVPDRAELTFSVTTEGSSSKAALAANAARTNRLISALKSAGLADRDIRTQQVAVSPRYGEGGQKLDQFTAENTITVKVESKRAGAIVDLAVENGATNVSGPTFDRTDREVRYRDALKEAVGLAREKAEAIAEAGSISVGDVTKVVEGAVDQPVGFAEAARSSAQGTPVEPGTEEIQATVTVTFAVS